MIARGIPSWRLLLTLLALVAQLAAGAAMPAVALSFADDAGVPICHGGQEPVDAPAPRHSHDCILCPLCGTAVGQSALLAAAAPAIPRPSVRIIGFAAPTPPATAPPAAYRVAAQPRAPPSLA